MKTTKNSIKARIKLALSLIKAAKEILSKIIKEIGAEDTDDYLFNWIDSIFEYDRSVSSTYRELEEGGYLDKIEEGSEVSEFTVNMIGGIYPEIIIPVDGGEFSVYAAESDYGIYQAGMTYTCKGSLFDLAFAEVKRGEIAKNDGLAENNRDVDLYVYGDQSTEDFTEKIRFPYDKFEAIASDEE